MMVVWLLVWRYTFLCVYITLADWLLVLGPKSGGSKHAFEIVWGPGPPWPPVPMPLDTFIVMSSLAAPSPSHRVRAGAARLSDEQVNHYFASSL